MKITVAGIGYVGLSHAILLAQHSEVLITDILPEKVNSVNAGRSPFTDRDIEERLGSGALSLKAALYTGREYENADFVIIATPTNYDDTTKLFNTASVESVIEKAVDANPNATIIIKSTVPVGFTQSMRANYKTDRIIFSPEFLREGRALYDSLYPSRIIVGDKTERGQSYSRLVLEGSVERAPVFFMDSSEAEAVKLFSNAYLAMRVAFFNELDTYAAVSGLKTKEIINGICRDDRIGDYYNNPSFGYGGYCLPKDTKQLKAAFSDIPNKLICAIVDSNDTRKEFIAGEIISKCPKTVGIHRLSMKTDSDNYRESSVLGIMKMIRDAGIDIIVYEPLLKETAFEGFSVCDDFVEFKRSSDIILTNRMFKELRDVEDKVYTRDIFSRD